MINTPFPWLRIQFHPLDSLAKDEGTFDVCDSPFGKLVFGEIENKLVAAAFIDPASNPMLLLEYLVGSNIRWHESSAVGEKYLAYLLGGGKEIHVAVAGTNLQQQVWQTLLTLTPDENISYGELAQRVGYPKAIRAVASAVGKNKISCFIPCHRIVHKSGNKERYGGGVDAKRKLQAWERTLV